MLVRIGALIIIVSAFATGVKSGERRHNSEGALGGRHSGICVIPLPMQAVPSRPAPLQLTFLTLAKCLRWHCITYKPVWTRVAAWRDCRHARRAIA